MLLSEFFRLRGRGALVALSKEVGAYAPDVSRWAAGVRSVPVERCFAIERATGGAVTRRDLRPDDWQQIWPELADSTAQEAAHG